MNRFANWAAKIKKSITDGDSVIWICVLLLMLISVVAIFSATSTLAIKSHTDRGTILMHQLILVGSGCLIMVFCCLVPNIKIFRGMGKMGFLVSFLLLFLLVFDVNLGENFHATTVNGASRAIYVFGFNLQVYEVVKIAMVMYLAWALQTYESGSFKLAVRLGTKFPKAFGWMKSERSQKWLCIFAPMMLVCIMILPGSTGSAILCGTVMLMTLLIGGIKFKDILSLVGVSVVCGLLMVSLHVVSSGKILERMQTAFNRFKIELPYPDPVARKAQCDAIAIKKMNFSELKPGSKMFEKYLDEVRQPKAAEIAIAEGGRKPFGKGPGKSTQKYAVPVMFEDYMYSILIEEYGLGMGFIILWMYLCLFARGGIIVNNCQKNRYAKACVGGLVFLITFQGLFHILINCNVGLVTGQTLPLISHGRCSFLCFCFAFGQILCISKMAKQTIEAQQIKEQENIAQASEDFTMSTTAGNQYNYTSKNESNN